MSDHLHFEDFPAGRVIELGPYEITAKEIKTYAAEFDPQPFHLDEEAARASLLGGLCASGWHGCAIMTRMIVDGYLGRTAGLGSGGMDEVKWLKPIYANQTLTGRATVISARPSRSQPGRGILQMLWELHDQQGIKILEMTGVQFVRVKAP